MSRLRTAAVAVGVAVLAVPAAAGAANKTMFAGAPLSKPPAGVPKEAGDISQFFPKSLTIRAGQTVDFIQAGFHTIELPKKGRKPGSFVITDPAKVVSGVKDAAGNDFWFNGQPVPLFNPNIFLGTKSGGAYDGSKSVHSGLPSGEGKPKPFKVKFTKAGTYTVYDGIHPSVTATIRVVGKRSAHKVPSAKADQKRVDAQLAKVIATLKALDKTEIPANTIVAGPDSKDGVTLFRFTPQNATVKVGDPVNLTMSDGSVETHTFTFARDLKALTKEANDTFIAPLPGGPKNAPPTLAFSPKMALVSDETLPAYDGTQHGDGFLNTGILDGVAATPFPQAKTVTFSAPGEYAYLCAIHTDMTGKITVTS